MFIIEFERRAISECWLQELNLPRILDRYPDKDCRRIDIAIRKTEITGMSKYEKTRAKIDTTLKKQRLSGED